MEPKHHSCYHQLLTVGFVISCFSSWALTFLPACIESWMGNWKKNAKTFFFIMLFCRYSIFINYFFDFYCKYFFPTMFQFLLNPLYLLSPKNAHPLFLSLVRQQIKSSNRKKEKQTNTQRNFLKKLNKRRNIKNTDWIIY